MQTGKGMLIAFEGIDCAGKTSIIQQLASRLSNDYDFDIIRTGEMMSEIKPFLRPENIKKYSPLVKTLLFAADRAFSYEALFSRPLGNHTIILWDRYVDSATIYRKVELSRKKANITEKYVAEVNQPFRKADITFFIDISVDTSISRAKESNRIEPYDAPFLAQVRKEYLDLSKQNGYIIINGEQSIDAIVLEIISLLALRLPNVLIDHRINQIRAREVVERLNQAYIKRTGLLENIDNLVENQIPQGVKPLSLEHASFLFYVVCNDHGMKSSRLYDKAKHLFLEFPELFVPAYIVSNYQSGDDKQLIELTGIYLGTRYPKQTSISWYQNSVKLMSKYGGDPRNLYSSSNDTGTLLKNILEFRSFGPKTGGMFLRALVGLGFSAVEGIEDVLLPVDIHDTRISYYTGILSSDSVGEFDSAKYYKYVKPVQRSLRAACKASGINWLNVDKALWLIGSNGCVSRRCSQCPLSDMCSIYSVGNDE